LCADESACIEPAFRKIHLNFALLTIKEDFIHEKQTSFRVVIAKVTAADVANVAIENIRNINRRRRLLL